MCNNRIDIKDAYELAKTKIGVKEIKGRNHNEFIVKFHQATTLKSTDDETPWCSSFVNWCCQMVGIKGTQSAAARSWLNWGEEIKKPYEGCIVIFQRGNSSWQGHVGFFVKDNGDNTIDVLGGNQSNAVNISAYSKNKLLGYRDTGFVKIKTNKNLFNKKKYSFLEIIKKLFIK